MTTLKRFFLLLSLLACTLFSGCELWAHIEIKKEKINEIELAYYTRGNGEPLVMIMGFRGSMALWDPGLLEILEKKYKLILFDNRGVGLSTDTEENLTTISQMADDTAKLIRSLGYQSAHVLGWSMGSRIALELAIKFPELVNSLILCSPNPGGKHQAPRKSDAYTQLTETTLSKEKGLSLIFPDTLQGREAAAALVKRLTEAVLKGVIPNDLKVSPQTVVRQVHALKLWDADSQLFEALPDIHKPTLVAGGLADALDSPENVRLIANQIPYAWSAYFAGAGHDFLSQDYKHFGELVILFIESNRFATN